MRYTLATLALLACTALAGDHSADLQPLDWMTGGTWTAEAKPPNGQATKVESRIRWSPNGHSIEFVTSFNGHEQYNGLYAWDPAAKTIRFFYTSAQGELTTGIARPNADGAEMEFDISNVKGEVNHFRSVVKKTGPDDYDWNVQSKRDGEWAVLLSLHYTRE